MKIVHNKPGNEETSTVSSYAEARLGQADYYAGAAERAAERADNNSTVLANLIELLAAKGVIDGPEIAALLGKYEEEPPHLVE